MKNGVSTLALSPFFLPASGQGFLKKQVKPVNLWF